MLDLQTTDEKFVFNGTFNKKINKMAITLFM